VSRACSAPRSAGWCWPSSPTRPGSARSGWLASSRLPPPEGPGPGPVAERLVAAATVAIPTDQAPMARTIIDRDRTLLATFNAQIAEADKRLAALLPRTPFAVLCSGPGWRVVRAASYGAAVGDPARWPSAGQVYRASGLCPATMPRPAAALTAPSAGKARSPCGGPCSRSGWAVAAGSGRPRLYRHALPAP
jgi:hypothetical protein